MATTENSNKQKDNKKKPYVGDGRMNNELSNPCLKEQKLSLKCVTENTGDKDACELYFVNYKNCKAFWNAIKKERRAAGIMPYLPLPEDRPEIIAKRRSPT